MGSFTRLHRNTHTKQPRLGSLILHQLTQPEASSKSVLRLMGGPLAKDFRKGGSPTMTENVHGGGLRPMSVFRDGGVCNGAGQNRRGGKKRLGVSPPWAAQRALVCTQACCPTTVHAGRFSLLCFQPEAILVSVAARTCQLPSAHPCRAPTWQGHAIDMLRRPCAVR